VRLLGAALLAAISKRCGVASKRARLRERAVVCLSQVKCVALCHVIDLYDAVKLVLFLMAVSIVGKVQLGELRILH